MTSQSSFKENTIDLTECIEQAVAFGQAGYTCAESVASAFAPVLGMATQDARRVVSGLAGGMGGHGATCGTVTAAICMLGWYFGPKTQEDVLGRQKVLGLTGEFMARYAERYGTTTCRELCTAGDPGTPEGGQAIRASGMPLKFIRSAAEILAELLRENKA
ncbi:MAG: C-GCAxxG-C-C family protein [Desulfovibrio sp.]|uniref:C-GCAxxG-C-C family protein n=1 Tax=Desulfovibrio sp. 7SRBS1 TaxID=3378064 RepID=UPI003B3C14BD